MDKLIKKIAYLTVIVFTVIAIAFSLILMFTGSPKVLIFSLNLSLYFTYFMCLVAIVLIFFLVFGQIASNKKQLIRTLLLGLGVVAIFLVCYWGASSTVSEIGLRIGVSETAYKWVGAMLNFTYITFLGVILAFVGTLIYVKIKNK